MEHIEPYFCIYSLIMTMTMMYMKAKCCRIVVASVPRCLTGDFPNSMTLLISCRLRKAIKGGAQMDETQETQSLSCQKAANILKIVKDDFIFFSKTNLNFFKQKTKQNKNITPVFTKSTTSIYIIARTTLTKTTVTLINGTKRLPPTNGSRLGCNSR